MEQPRRRAISLRMMHVHAMASIIAIAAVAPGTGRAQDQAAPQTGIQDIVVTAQKRQESANDVGLSITAVSGTQLERAGIRSAEDLVKVVPGFTYVRSAYGAPIFTLRGMGFYSDVANAAPTVSVYQDETPYPYAFMTRGLGFDVQRVEVLKGPQGTLFGLNSTGGAINYIANRPTEEFGAGLDVSYSSYDRIDATAYISGAASETLKARVVAHVENGGAWQKSYTRGDKNGATRFYAGRVLLDWDPTPGVSLKLNINGWLDKSDELARQIIAIANPTNKPASLLAAFAQYPAQVPGARYADFTPGNALGLRDTFWGTHFDGFKRDNDFYQLALRGDFKLGDNATLTSITAYSAFQQYTIIDTDGMNVSTYHVGNIADIKSFSQELRLAGTNGPLQWLIGGNYSDDKINVLGLIYSLRGFGTFPFRTAGALADNSIKTYAVFANAEYALTDTLSVIAGIRYTKTKNHNEGCTTDGGDGDFSRFVTARFGAPTPPLGACVTLDIVTRQPGLVINDLNQENVPFKLGVNWKPNNDTLVYASASRGYKIGSFTPVGAIFSPALDPATQERVMAYEIGAKLGFWGRRAQLNTAAFYYDYRNKQVVGKELDPVAGPLNKLVNIPKSKVTGAEVQLTVIPVEGLTLNAGGTYIFSEILDSFINTTAAGRDAIQMAGDTLPFTPKWQFVADAEYALPLSGDLEGFVGAGGRKQSSSFAGLGEEPQFFIDGYTTVDLRAGVRDADDKWSATVFVNNVTNKYSWNNVALAGPDAITRSANMPRIFGVRVSLKQ